MSNHSTLPPANSTELSRRRLGVLCGILLAATLINYACRTTLAQNSVEIKAAFHTDDQGYGRVEGWFGLGFAFGGLLFGFLSDKVNVRWLYPAVVAAWSVAGMAPAWIDDLTTLSISRFLLGLFEAGHWPCALRTTQRIFAPAQRTLGNSLLQSGASVGAIVTPLLIAAIHHFDPDKWRWSFVLTGTFCLPWIVVWLLTIRSSDLQRPVIATDELASGAGEQRVLAERTSWSEIVLSPRWWVLVVITISINTTWQFIRVWLPDTMRQQYGYSKEFTQYFTSAYYAATFVGSIAAGSSVAWLAARGLNVHRARVIVFATCAVLVSWLIPAAFFAKGTWYLASWLVIGVGALGLFPVYYSLNQEMSASHQGRVSGVLSFTSWLVQFFVHPAVGAAFKETPAARPYLFAAIGVLPLLSLVVLMMFWGKVTRSASDADVTNQS